MSARLTKAILKRMIVASQRAERFSARGAYSYGNSLPSDGAFPQAEAEFADSAGFLPNFEHCPEDLTQSITGKRVLDFGSGYGGRTVWYAQYAAEVHGIEVFANMVTSSNAFAVATGVTNCSFSVGSEHAIAFPDGHFDVVISNDVLEHVADPETILTELHRVLAPGGLAFLVFTPYWGMFSHHLNYITMLPGVHWIFAPDTITTACNELLINHPQFIPLGISEQPRPRLAYDGSRLVLPTLNGMTKRGFLRIIRSINFEPLFLRSTPILERFPVAGRFGVAANRLLCSVPLMDEALGHNLVTVLRKRQIAPA